MKGYKDAHAQACMRAYAKEHFKFPYEFAAEINRSRFEIPEQNRLKFDIEAKDTIRCYKDSFDIGDQYQVEWIRRRWESRLAILRVHGCHNTPPMLIQRDGESQRDWLDRCYRAWRG